jgi:hypothetical protein
MVSPTFYRNITAIQIYNDQKRRPKVDTRCLDPTEGGVFWLASLVSEFASPKEVTWFVPRYLPPRNNLSSSSVSAIPFLTAA